MLLVSWPVILLLCICDCTDFIVVDDECWRHVCSQRW